MNKILRVKLLRLILLSFIVLIVVSCADNFLKPNGSNISEKITTFSGSERITLGEKSLAFNEESFNPKREKAIRSIADGDYNTAFRTLTDYLKSKPNDPEARIFLNNVEVEKSKKPYHIIAVSMPISSNLNASLEILRGVAHAQSDWNNSRSDAGGMLKIVIADDADPSNGTKIAEEVATGLGERKEILGVVGHYSSDTSLATAKIYQNYQLVSISPISTSVELIGYSPYFFRTVPSDRVAAKALAKYTQAQLKSVKAVVFYNSDSNYSKSLSQEFISELGKLNIILGEDPDCDLATWSESPEDWREKATKVLNKAKDSANVLMLAPSSGDLNKALEIVWVNNGELPIVAGDAVYSTKTLNQAQNTALGMVVAIAWDIEANESGSDFPQRSQKLWGTSSVNWRTITAYDALQALGRAIEKQAQPTREGVREQLSSNFSTPGALKVVKFLDSGDYDGGIQLVEVQKIGSRYDFVPLQP